MLALYASIEAARAGEHGRGFAVVAEEVRKLVVESKQSAADIQALIETIQSSTEQAVLAMNASEAEVHHGVEQIQEVGSSMAQIQAAIEKVAKDMEELSAVAEQMSASSEEVAAAAEEIATSAEDAAGHAQQVAAAAEEQMATMDDVKSAALSLKQMADRLHEMVQQFKV